MRKFISIFLICAANTVDCQITITQSHMPSIGDTVRYSSAPLSGSQDFTATGTGYSWDFSDLGLTSQDIYRFQALLSTPYSTLAFTGMPLGAIGYKVADSIGTGQTAVRNIYNFFDKKSAGWSAVGTGFTLSAVPFPAGGVYSDKDEIYLFPLTYPKKDSTSFHVKTPLGNIILNLGYLRQTGNRVTTVDGYGTVSTPYASNVNCIRLKSVVTEMDSLVIPSLSVQIGFPANRVEYKWLVTSEKIPLLEVSGTVISGNYIPAQIRYRDVYRNPSPSVLKPVIRFYANKYEGFVGDTFQLVNTSTPPVGVGFEWGLIPSGNETYVNGTSFTSREPAFVFNSPGLYSLSCKAVNSFGFSDTVATNYFDVKEKSSGLTQPSATGNFIIRQNPATDKLKLNNALTDNSHVRLFGMDGRCYYENTCQLAAEIDVMSLSPGTYSIVLIKNNKLFFDRFIKQ